MTHPHQTIAITVGDPTGIGPEIVAKAIDQLDGASRPRLRVLCHETWFESLATSLGCDLSGVLLDDCSAAAPIADAGAAQVAYLEKAVSLALAGDIGALVTAPIHKGRARAAGFEFFGHTDFLAARLKAERVAMMFASPRQGPSMRVVLATIHVPLASISSVLDAAAITNAIDLSVLALEQSFAIREPRIAILGLNPHAGEDGHLGREEIDIIAPAIEAARARHPNAELVGPLVPDVAFRKPADLYVAMYHDQGLIPLKLLHFDEAVNVTLGLPIVRTSPDHGTADDIAGRGIARADSFIAALQMAREMLDTERLARTC